ncbi:hypothetical protein GGI18_003672 [Coemansia linderi]|uniref:Uncharacterized protein n=1 Tax=Coemansia linderi TaxID=2663919 RepID=A0ACC1KC35_9FUNG|nr:hypothetical protein GGI18_003672 [Coemansia linderi]
MDKLLLGVQSQTIDLCSYDLIPSFVNISFYFFYGNDGSESRFMPTDILRESFYLALLEFPILVGHLEIDSSGHAKVVVDRSNLNIPEFNESLSNVHFRGLQASKFSWDALPEGANSKGVVNTANSRGDIKPANVHAVRLLDNSGIVLYVSIAHYAVDGIGYCEFVSRWAEIHQWVCLGRPINKLPACHCHFERSILRSCLPDDRKALDAPTRELITGTGPLVRWLAWVSPKTRAKLFKASFLLGSVSCVPSDVRLSDNDVLTALLTMVVAQSEAESKREAASANYLSSLVSYLFPAMYEPDSSSMESLTCDINEQSLARVAKSAWQLVDGVVPQHIGQHINTLHEDQTRFMCPSTYAVTKATLLLTNQSRFPLYQADFGNGIPTWVSPIQTFFPNFSSILPAHPMAGGYAIYISMAERAMARILQNKFWMSMVDKVY